MVPLTSSQLRHFAQRGYIVVPNVVPRDLIAAARQQIDRLVERDPPPPDRRGPHFYWRNDLAAPDGLLGLLTNSPAMAVAAAMIEPLTLEVPRQAQVSLNIPPYAHRPGGPHLDGLTPPEPSGRPATFTMLAGVFLTEQQAPDMGNLWVWPGSHRVCEAHLRKHGADALLGLAHPQLAFAPPEQVLGASGDLLLAHYLLGHNMGTNLSATTRQVVYFRLRSLEHANNWRDYVQDSLLEFAPVQAALESGTLSD
jgi:ectoine hydroxylase-related dioxygenase (phytanoyl-CoA dioxygenase family)